MNFQQLRSLREAARRGFNLTEVARVLNTSQPGVSRQIRELEDELGVDLFVRAGKRLTALTEMGELVLPTVENMLRDADNLRRAGEEFSQQLQGPLSIAATHSQARYALPGAVRDFRVRFPGVRFNLHQGSPDQVADMLITGEADVGIATEALSEYDELVTLPCYRWTHSVIVPKGHPAARRGPADARRPGRLSDHHLQPRLHRAAAHRRRLREGRPGVRSDHHGDGRRRDQDLRRARPRASASSPRSPSTRHATPTCTRSTPATCSPST